MKKKIKIELKSQEEVFSKCRRNLKDDNIRKMETSEILSEKDKQKQKRARRKIKEKRDFYD